MNQRRNLLVPVILVLGVEVGSSLWVRAGSLDPPGGAITGTMKDLETVEPRKAIRNNLDASPVTITSRGSYYLAENIFALPSQDGIRIDAFEVTLDLNGFSIVGNTDTGSNNGVFVVANRHNVTIKNGTIGPFTQDGISATSSEQVVLENLRLLANSTGARLGDFARVTDCIANDNQNDGIQVGAGSIVSRCIVTDNGNDAFDSAIRAGTGSLVESCMALSNTGNGIRATNGSIVRGCTSRSNTATGVDANSGLVHGCSATQNAINISAFTSVDNNEN